MSGERFTDDMLADFKRQFDDHVREEHDMQTNLKLAVEENSRLVQSVHENTAGILEAWNTATGLVKFVKFVSGGIAAVAIIWAAVTHGFSGK